MQIAKWIRLQGVTRARKITGTSIVQRNGRTQSKCTMIMVLEPPIMTMFHSSGNCTFFLNCSLLLLLTDSILSRDHIFLPSLSFITASIAWSLRHSVRAAFD